MEVPRVWYEHRTRAKRVIDNLNKSVLAQDGVLETGLVRDDKNKYDGVNGLKIEISVDPNKSVDLPDVASGLGVRTQELEPEAVRGDSCENIGDFDPYPGGVNIKDYASKDLPCTSGYPVFSGTGKYDIVTAAHCLINDCDLNIGDDVYQDTEYLGDVIAGDAQADVAIIGLDTGKLVKNAIREPDGTMRDVKGRVSEIKIENRAANFFDGHTKVGCTTGITKAGIKKAHVTRGSCPTLKGHGFTSGHDAADGDSGGPHYWIDNGDAYIMGHHFGSKNLKDKTATCHGERKVWDVSYCMPAYWVENNLGFTVP